MTCMRENALARSDTSVTFVVAGGAFGQGGRTSRIAGATVATVCSECFGHGGRGESNLASYFHNVIETASGTVRP
jgi:hypothetical protein